MNGVDITTLMTVVDDVAVGDVSLEGLFPYYYYYHLVIIQQTANHNIICITFSHHSIILNLFIFVFLFFVDVDLKLLKTLQLSQYSVQYLLSCQTAMKNNKKLINESLKVFDREEALLDLRLAKMRLAG